MVFVWVQRFKFLFKSAVTLSDGCQKGIRHIKRLCQLLPEAFFSNRRRKT